MIPFTKMHGIGNDYVYVNGFEVDVPDPSGLSRMIADRHRGVGGDGLILILPPEDARVADVRMRMFNADGSESEMCGNGVRCVAKYAIDHGLSDRQPLRVSTGRGVLSIDWTVDETGLVREATVDMGPPLLDLEAVPVDAAQLAGRDGHESILELDGSSLRFVAVSMGNPHAVTFVESLDSIDLARVGPLAEHHPAFPQRMNLHVVEVKAPDEVSMRTWERGSGLTQACGTGASAVCVAGVLTGRTERRILAHLPGGDLTLDWPDPDASVLMTGPATEVFTGAWPDDAQRPRPTAGCVGEESR